MKQPQRMIFLAHTAVGLSECGYNMIGDMPGDAVLRAHHLSLHGLDQAENTYHVTTFEGERCSQSVASVPKLGLDMRHIVLKPRLERFGSIRRRFQRRLPPVRGHLVYPSSFPGRFQYTDASGIRKFG